MQLLFMELDSLMLDFMLLLDNLKKLAKHYIPLSDKYKNEDDIVNMFKQRLQKIETEPTN